MRRETTQGQAPGPRADIRAMGPEDHEGKARVHYLP